MAVITIRGHYGSYADEIACRVAGKVEVESAAEVIAGLASGAHNEPRLLVPDRPSRYLETDFSQGGVP